MARGMFSPLNGPLVKTKRAAMYVRVSSGEQNTGAQERALREYVQRRGWKVQQIYCDQGISGASSNRPALNELMKACRRRYRCELNRDVSTVDRAT